MDGLSQSEAIVRKTNERLKQSDRVSVVGIDGISPVWVSDEEIASHGYRACIAKLISDIPKSLAREIASLDAEPVSFRSTNVMRAP